MEIWRSSVCVRSISEMIRSHTSPFSMKLSLGFNPRVLGAPSCKNMQEDEKNNTHMVTFGFPEKNSIIKRKKTKQRKKEDKKWRKLCLKLKDRGVVIPITMIKNPVAKEYFS